VAVASDTLVSGPGAGTIAAPTSPDAVAVEETVAPQPVAIVQTLPSEEDVPRPQIALAQPDPPASEPVPPEPIALEQAFADFSLPARPSVAEGAVDITLITPRREAPAAEAEPPKPAHPSRHWVQVA